MPDAHASATPPLLSAVLAPDRSGLPRSATRFVHACAFQFSCIKIEEKFVDVTSRLCVSLCVGGALSRGAGSEIVEQLKRITGQTQEGWQPSAGIRFFA